MVSTKWYEATLRGLGFNGILNKGVNVWRETSVAIDSHKYRTFDDLLTGVHVIFMWSIVNEHYRSFEKKCQAGNI